MVVDDLVVFLASRLVVVCLLPAFGFLCILVAAHEERDCHHCGQGHDERGEEGNDAPEASASCQAPAQRLYALGGSETSFTVHIRAILCNRLLPVASAMSSITMPSE